MALVTRRCHISPTSRLLICPASVSLDDVHTVFFTDVPERDRYWMRYADEEHDEEGELPPAAAAEDGAAVQELATALQVIDDAGPSRQHAVANAVVNAQADAQAAALSGFQALCTNGEAPAYIQLSTPAKRQRRQ